MILLSLPLLDDAPRHRVAPVCCTDQASSPRNPHVHLFESGSGPNVFVVNGSQVYAIGPSEKAKLATLFSQKEDPDLVKEVLKELGLDQRPFIVDAPVQSPPLRALSLAVAQKCNLGCTYCYAQGGSFGGAATTMPPSVALAAVERLFEEAGAGDRVNLAFLGGEPLFGRDVIRIATERAARLGAERGVEVAFSITTNGTLVTSDDGEFFERHGFAVTISLDGLEQVHDRLRPFKGGQGSFARVLANVKPLLARQRRMQVSARVTVTPQNVDLFRTLNEFLDLGFHSVGFSPMISSPTGRDEIEADSLETMLEQMMTCGHEFERRVIAGERYPFANMVNALREIHRGTHRPYPCGAGAGYMGVSAEGGLFACHRFVSDDLGAMGNLAVGVDGGRQNRWLADRHVHRQEPCRSCWARYLCGGGCHHEVIHRGRPACDYIRGWLHYCLEAYVRLLAARPDFFTDPSGAAGTRPRST
jgi:uncharacterized protein